MKQAKLPKKIRKALDEGKTICLSCGKPLVEGEDLYEGYGCPYCQSPLVVKAEKKE